MLMPQFLQLHRREVVGSNPSNEYLMVNFHGNFAVKLLKKITKPKAAGLKKFSYWNIVWEYHNS